MKRKIIFLLLVTNALTLTFNFSTFAQSGQKWAVDGNSINNGDFIGTMNNQPLWFKVNNALALYIKQDGNVFVNSLKNGNINNGIVTHDDSGQLISLIYPNDATKVFLGNGTWGNIPLPADYWHLHNNDLYTLTSGNIGIGTDHPNYKVDILGSVRISQNLYVGGGIIISDKVNATQELKSAALRADSIIMDSTKAFYGESKFEGDVKLKYKLDVTGDVNVNGNIRTLGNLTFGGNKTLGYLPAYGGNPEIIYFSSHPEIPTLSPCFPSLTTPLSILQQEGIFQAFGNDADGNINKMSMGFNGTDAVIDIENEGINNITTEPKLLINYYCGKDVSINAGLQGGDIQLTSTGKVGIGTDNPQKKFHVFNMSSDVNEGTALRLQWAYDGMGIPGTTWDMQALTGKLLFKTPDYNASVLTLTKTGKVGVGTDSPQANFHIKGITDFSIEPEPLPGDEQSALSAVLRIEDNVINSSNNRNVLWDYTVSGFQQKMFISNKVNGGTTNFIMTFLENGDCGIGTTSPTAKLDIAGDLKIGNLPEYSSATNVIVEDGTGKIGKKSTLSLGDNLGNHTATQNIILGDNWLTASTTENNGLHLTPDGNLTMIINGNNSFEIKGGNEFPYRRGIGIPDEATSGQFNFYINPWQTDAAFNFNSHTPGYTDQGTTYPEATQTLMTILKNGKIGIGTTNPTKNLQVAGNACFGQDPEISAFPLAKVKIYGDGSATQNINWTATHSLVLQGTTTAMSFGVDPVLNKAYISATTTTPDAGTDLILNSQGGNIGIGTNAPIAKLDVAGLVNATGYLLNGLPIGQWVTSGSNINYSNGNVGIGTTCPTEKLAVNGKIRVKDEIIIDNTIGWCDYVFSPKYKLLTIPELEKYLIEHQHMPNVKSASEMEKSGYNVLETNKQMMEKIEELTLYIIQLEKRISELEKK